MIKNIALVIVGLWLFKKFGHAHDAASQRVELAPTDPYGSITNQWETIAGNGLGNIGPYGVNAHTASFWQATGQDPKTDNPCVCH